MRHVDDGLLNAWLDGELHDAGERGVVERHLAGCASCRGRLESERRVRQRAGELLSETSAAPPAGVPFSELVARASAGAPPAGRPARGGRRGRWWVPASWAASVLLALALGWNARELVQGGDTEAGNGLPAPRRAAVVVQEAAVSEIGHDRVEPGEPAPAASSPARSQAAPLPAATRHRSADAVAEVTFQAVLEGEIAPTWAQLADRIGAPVYRLEGLEPLSVEVVEDSALVRSVYALPAGGRVELLQEVTPRPAGAPAPRVEGRAEAAAPQAAAGTATGTSVLTVERDGVRLTLAGELPPAELARLAERLRSD
jgi:hypothetical protein